MCVAILAMNHPTLMIAFSAIVRAGGVAVVVSDSATVDEVEAILSHCLAAILVTTSARSRQVAPKSVNDHDERDDAQGPTSIARLVSQHAPLRRPISRTAGDPAQIVYTSGSNGALGHLFEAYESTIQSATTARFAIRRSARRRHGEYCVRCRCRSRVRCSLFLCESFAEE